MENLRNAINKVSKFLEQEHEIDGSTFQDLFSSFRTHFKYPLEDARLAHYKHAIEYISRKINETNISIVYDSIVIPSGRKATVRYLKGGYIVTVHATLPAEEKRMLIGHELGHILISVLNEEIYNPAVRKLESHRETVANILCFVMHVDQGKFYQSKQCKNYVYPEESYNDLLDKIVEITKKPVSPKA